MPIGSYLRKAMGLNAYHGSKTKYTCTLHAIAGNEVDAEVDIVGPRSKCQIKLHSENMYLTADGTADGSSISWTPKSSSMNQFWKLQEKSVISFGASTTIYAKVGNAKTGALTKAQMDERQVYIQVLDRPRVYQEGCLRCAGQLPDGELSQSGNMADPEPDLGKGLRVRPCSVDPRNELPELGSRCWFP